MNVETGQMYEGVEAIQEAKAAGEPIMRVPKRDADRVRAMTPDHRKAYAKRVMASRKARKQKRKADRKRRGRR